MDVCAALRNCGCSSSDNDKEKAGDMMKQNEARDETPDQIDEVPYEERWVRTSSLLPDTDFQEGVLGIYLNGPLSPPTIQVLIYTPGDENEWYDHLNGIPVLPPDWWSAFPLEEVMEIVVAEAADIEEDEEREIPPMPKAMSICHECHYYNPRMRRAYKCHTDAKHCPACWLDGYQTDDEVAVDTEDGMGFKTVDTEGE